jgi:PAS domain S-box-containing protein
MHWWHSLRYQVFAATLALSLLPLLMVGLFFREGVAGSFRSQTLANSTGDGEQAQAILAERGQRILAVAEAIASGSSLIQATTARNSDQLASILQTRSSELNGAEVTVVDRSGTVLAQAGPPSEPRPLVAGSGFAAVLDGQTVLTAEQGGPSSLVERAYVPVMSNGTVLGAILTRQDIDAEFLQSLRRSAGLNAFAILPDGSVANAQLRPADVLRIRSAPGHLVNFVPVNGVSSAIYTWQVNDGTGSPVGQLGVVLSTQGMERAIADLRRIALLAGAIAVLGATALAWVLSRIMLRPLERISTAAQAIAGGEHISITPLKRTDEVGALSRSLASMVTSLAGNEDRLQRIIETIADGILMLDQQGRYRLTNAAAEQLLDVPRSAIIGKPWYESPWRREALDGSPFPDEAYPFQRVQRTQVPVYGVEFVIVRPDQRRVAVSVNAAPLYEPDGTFSGMVVSFTDITERKRAEQQLEHELERAGAVQLELLPQQQPSLKGFALAARCISARQVGGDFYDWQDIGDDHLTLVLGDVMGKGLPAALLMATVRASLRAVVRQSLPAEAMRYIVPALEDDLSRTEGFVTMFLAQLDARAHTLSYVDAGHGHAFIRRSSGEAEALLPHNLPVGVEAEISYAGGMVQLSAGDALVLYSDGVIDAEPAAQLTPQALAVRLDGARSAEDMVNRLCRAAASCPGPLQDDVTALVLLCTS